MSYQQQLLQLLSFGDIVAVVSANTGYGASHDCLVG